MDYAAVDEEARDLKAAGADVIQTDEPWLQARPEAAKHRGVRAIKRALQGIPGPTVVHLCFGYAHVVHDEPSGYSFLPQLADCIAEQISIEAAQPNLDLGMLRNLSSKTILLGIIGLGDPRIEAAEEVAARLRRGLAHVPAERLIAAPECGMKHLARRVAFGKLRALAGGTAIVRQGLQAPPPTSEWGRGDCIQAAGSRTTPPPGRGGNSGVARPVSRCRAPSRIPPGRFAGYRPPAPRDTGRSIAWIRGISNGSHRRSTEPGRVVHAAVNPASRTIRAVSGVRSPYGYANRAATLRPNPRHAARLPTISRRCSTSGNPPRAGWLIV